MSRLDGQDCVTAITALSWEREIHSFTKRELKGIVSGHAFSRAANALTVAGDFNLCALNTLP
jgi:hypothetical protein